MLPALKAARCTCRARGRPGPPPLLLHRSTLRSPLLLASRRRRAFDLAPPPPAKRSVPLFRISVRTRHDAQLTPWLQPELFQSLQRTEADKGEFLRQVPRYHCETSASIWGEKRKKELVSRNPPVTVTLRLAIAAAVEKAVLNEHKG